MVRLRRWLPVAVLWVFVQTPAYGQGAVLTPAQVAPFLGTWVIEMTDPPAFKGTHTVRVWDKNGVVAASVQNGNFPPNDVTGREHAGSNHQP